MGKHHTKGDFCEPFKGPVVPFGSLIQYHPISAKDQSQESTNLERKYSLESSSVMFSDAGRIWKGDILVMALGELEEMDASEIHAKRLSAKEVILPESG